MNLVQDLISRRLPQILIGYLVASWGLVQFAEFLESRYDLSARLVEVVGLGLLMLIPSVLLMGYRHGRPGKDAWSKIDLVVIPANLVIAAAAMIVVIQGNALGDVTETISVADEDGTVSERQVPKDEYRRNITLFFFDNESGDPGNDWVSHAITNLVHMDLYQDLYLDAGNPYAPRQTLEEAGFPEGVNLPQALQRKIATERHSQSFLTGSFGHTDEGWQVRAQLHDTDGGTVIAEHEVTSAEIFDAVDQLTDQVRQDLKIPAALIEASQNLPVREVFTASPIALRHYVDGTRAIWDENDYDKAAAEYHQALEADPTFCAAAFQKFVALSVSQKSDEAHEAMREAMKHLYQVPERFALAIKANYFLNVQQDGERALAVSKMWVELYPNDIDAHATLATFYQFRDEMDLAIAEVEQILEIDPTQHRYLRAIAELYKSRGNYDGASTALRRYADEYPNDPRSFRSLASLMEDFGRIEDAQKEIERALLLEPESVTNLLMQARLTEKLGDFDAARGGYEALLELADSPRERYQAYGALQGLYELTGQLAKAIEFRELHHAEGENVLMPVEVTATRSHDMTVFVEAGRVDEARERLDKLCEPLESGPLAAVAASAQMAFSLELGDTTGVSARIHQLEDFIDRSGLELMRFRVHASRAKRAELANDYDAAATAYANELHFDPNSVRILRDLGRCYRQLRDNDSAHEFFGHALRVHRSHPRTHYELALLYVNERDQQKALQHLATALEGWKNADANFQWATKARELYEELKRSS